MILIWLGEWCRYNIVCSFDGFFDVAIESCKSMELLLLLLLSGMFGEDESETNCFSLYQTFFEI